VTLVAAGVATSEIGIGFAIGAAGVLVTAHGVDTVAAGTATALAGEQIDTFTSQGLQKYGGLSRTSANLVDAGIGVVGTFGAGAATRAAPAAAEGLVHLTTAERAAAITAEQTLGKGATIYAGPGVPCRCCRDPCGSSRLLKKQAQGIDSRSRV
jgi:hypothetical protein